MENEETKLDSVFSQYGMEAYSYDYICDLRKNKVNRKLNIIPQAGGQEKVLSSEADFIITGGVRGGGKSASLLMQAYEYIGSPYFTGSIFRKEKNDAKRAGGIVGDSNNFYRMLGTYNKSESDMTWNFEEGGRLNFDYYSDSASDFKDRHRGQQLAYIGIDEITQMPYEHWKFLITCLRSSHGLKTKMIGTCNPDAESWVYRFISGRYSPTKNSAETRPKWIDESGRPIPEMDGKILYFYMWGEREDQIYFGETKEEVYMQAKDEIDKRWTKEMEEFGNKLDMFIFSATFIYGKLIENKILLDNDPSYFKNLNTLTEEEKARDLDGIWMPKGNAESLITPNELNAIFNNNIQSSDYKCITVDVSLKGKDASVMYYWEGFHLLDAKAVRMGAESLKAEIRLFMDKHMVLEEDVCYDDTGIGTGLEEHFMNAMHFIANTMAFDKKQIEDSSLKQYVSAYENVKAQCVDMCAKRIKSLGYSIDQNLLFSNIDGKMLIDHLREEYIALGRDSKVDNKFKAITKPMIIQKIGHSSDFFDAFYLREYIELVKGTKKEVKRKGIYFI